MNATEISDRGAASVIAGQLVELAKAGVAGDVDAYDRNQRMRSLWLAARLLGVERDVSRLVTAGWGLP